MARNLPAMDQDLRADVRHGRRLGHRDVVPVRHQLARIHEHGRQYRRAAAGVRSPDRVLPRGDVSRGDALRHEPGPGMGAHAVHRAGGSGHHTVGILDPRAQLVDANTDRACLCRRRARGRRLVGGDVQSIVPVPPDAYAARFRPHGCVRGGRVVGVAAAAGGGRPRRAPHAPNRPRDRRRARAAPGVGGRSARPQHARAPAGEDRGNGGGLEDRQGRAACSVRHTQRGGAAQ